MNDLNLLVWLEAGIAPNLAYEFNLQNRPYAN